MADYIEPTKTEYKNTEQVAVDVVSQAYPEIITKTGSVIRELVIRPLSYLLSWLKSNTANDIKQYSVSYLKTSQLTDNPIADMVASNYFVERRQGTPAKGVVTLTLNLPTLRIAAGAVFSVGGVQTCTEKQYLVTETPLQDNDLVSYIKAVPYKDRYWLASIPVVTVANGPIEVPLGAPVTLGFSCTSFEAADLTSPITGGSGTETDAQLMQRAEYNTAESGIGSYYGIKKKLSKAPVTVDGMSVIAGEDAPLFRARNNSVGINPGGYVDCHVKTANQTSIGTILNRPLVIVDDLDENEQVIGQHGEITLGSDDESVKFPGFIRLNSLLIDGIYRDKYSVAYSTLDPNVTAEGARLSNKQEATVIVTLENNGNTNAPIGPTTNTAIEVEYMPGITALQNYMDSDVEHFIGQDTLIKAAVPVSVGVTCAYYCERELTDAEVEDIKQTIVDYINTTEVGIGKLNFSDIREACLKTHPDVTLRLPCVFTAAVSLQDGMLDTFNSTSGILDITHNPTYNRWGYQICFFSCCVANVELDAV